MADVISFEGRKVRRAAEAGANLPLARAMADLANRTGKTVDDLFGEVVGKLRGRGQMTPEEFEAQQKSWVIRQMRVLHPEVSKEEAEAMYARVRSRRAP